VGAEPLSLSLAGGDSVSALLDVPAGAHACYVMAHGAGAGMTHSFMAAAAEGLARRGVATLRYQFPFVEHGSKRPDPPAVAHAAVRAAVAQAQRRLPALPCFAGGKSFGGRMTSQAQAKTPLPGVIGLVFFGFPLHPAGKPGSERAAHLEEVGVPMLFLQGTRDALAESALIEAANARAGRARNARMDRRRGSRVPRAGPHGPQGRRRSGTRCWTVAPRGSRPSPPPRRGPRRSAPGTSPCAAALSRGFAERLVHQRKVCSGRRRAQGRCAAAASYASRASGARPRSSSSTPRLNSSTESLPLRSSASRYTRSASAWRPVSCSSRPRLIGASTNEGFGRDRLAVRGGRGAGIRALERRGVVEPLARALRARGGRSRRRRAAVRDHRQRAVVGIAVELQHVLTGLRLPARAALAARRRGRRRRRSPGPTAASSPAACAAARGPPS
jgi:predicted alpha/beta-hydrolase family hydrolase